MAGADIYIDERAVIGGTPHSMLAFEEAAALLDLEPWIVQRLRHPIDESTAHLQITRDSGEPVCVPFFSIHHNQVSGCSAGSLALAPGLQLRDCQDGHGFLLLWDRTAATLHPCSRRKRAGSTTA